MPYYAIMSVRCFSDITSGSVHLAVCWIDQSSSLPIGSKCCLISHHSFRWTLPLPLERQIFKWLVMANRTHTWWHNITPLTFLQCHTTLTLHECRMTLTFHAFPFVSTDTTYHLHFPYLTALCVRAKHLH